MPQEQMPESLWIKVEEGHHQRYISVYSVPATEHIEYVPASRFSALAERVERAEALLCELWNAWEQHHGVCAPDDGCDRCNELRDMYSRIHNHLHDGKVKP